MNGGALLVALEVRCGDGKPGLSRLPSVPPVPLVPLYLGREMVWRFIGGAPTSAWSGVPFVLRALKALVHIRVQY